MRCCRQAVGRQLEEYLGSGPLNKLAWAFAEMAGHGLGFAETGVGTHLTPICRQLLASQIE